MSAKEGNDVIIVDMCHTSYGTSHPKDYYPHSDYLSQGTSVWKDPGGDEYLVRNAFFTIFTIPLIFCYRICCY